MRRVFHRSHPQAASVSTPRITVTTPSRTFHSSHIQEMKVELVPILSDNYSYIITCDKSNKATVVDPAEPDTVLAEVQTRGYELEAVLTTHKHWDHAGGNEKIYQQNPSIEIIGPAKDNIPAVTKMVNDNDKFTLADDGLQVQVLYTPCHTRGHVLYLVTDPALPDEPPALFSGDTLFVGGCGRFFEGDASMMQKAMDRIAKLPPATRIYCGHEYTAKNLQFAKTVEPENEALENKLRWVQTQRSANLPTIPSTVAEELSYNPFMRTNSSNVMRAVGKTDAVSTMAEVRSRKDSF